MADPIAQDIVDELLRRMEPIAAEMRAQRARGVPLDAASFRALHGAFVDGLRARGWLRDVEPERLADVIHVLVVTDDDGNAELDVETEITGSVVAVPGWGVTETDAAAVGRGLAEDEADLLDDAREAGETTGWE